MKRGSLLAGVIALFLVATACAPNVDLSKALTLTDMLSGYYDHGVRDGKPWLPPSITFRLHNISDRTIGPLQLTVAFWREGEDGEWNSVLIQGVGSEGLKPGASTEPLTIRSKIGFTLAGTRDDFFGHSLFRDVTAKMFAKRSGRIFPLGAFKMERRIIPHAGPRP